MTNRKWTIADLNRIAEMRQQGDDLVTIARKMQCTSYYQFYSRWNYYKAFFNKAA